jgi:anaerobic selenocysteine-containing dehydrogenase
VQYTPRVVAPAGERREEWWILARLCRELGFKGPLDDGDEPDVFARLARMLERGGVALDALKSEPGGVLLDPLAPGRFFADQIGTLDARVDCCPAIFADAIAAAARQFEERGREPAGRLRLITKRDRFMHNSWFHNVDKLKRRERGRNYLFVHPDDARRLGLADDAVVRVESDAGAIELPVRVDDDLMPGVVAATHGWGHDAATGMRIASERPGVNVNRLLPSGLGSYDPLSNMAFMTGIPVEVRRVEDARS